jgi:hypothetical protein
MKSKAFFQVVNKVKLLYTQRKTEVIGAAKITREFQAEIYRPPRVFEPEKLPIIIDMVGSNHFGFGITLTVRLMGQLALFQMQ